MAGNINYKSICCEQIPELFLDKLVAKNHFRRFGEIVAFVLRPGRLSCTVEYASEDAAERALMEGAEFNGHQFVINYAERDVGHVQNTEEWVDPDIQAELEAMGGGGGSARFSHPQPVALASRSKYAMEKPVRSAPLQTPRPAKPIPAPPVVVAPAPSQATPKIDASVRNELENLLRTPAYSNEERYRVLDARDKLIRLRTVRQTDIKKAVSSKGTCPDMCPEKERLMRDFQRQVAGFEYATEEEQAASSISHRRAIKEYSRSSADQEVPLSHELRPEGVLKMTMLYLMHYVMDLCDDPQTSLGDWFHFVWDRTRSIRKDITQQELCSLGTVELVEQCARFHIHCAARLVAEDPSVFDKKINAENLTKCLQSLKYMYHDLRIKNVPCPCEAEFRSYIVLLNLGDANFLWELKQLPEQIQKSKDIQRAIAFYNALQNNNYVRFFEMIRSEETSYMSACILLGYFNRLRLRAMDVIVKAHLWRKNDVLPLRYVTRVLGFESEESAADFFMYHGLQCDEHRVYLDRLKMPDMEYSMNRALELVETKRMVSVGECICGHPLDPPDVIDRHQPHNSFDDYGLLKAEAWTADDQLRGDEAIRRKQQQQQEQQKQQQIKPLNVNVGMPPPPASSRSAASDNAVFKVPRPSPPLPMRQQQAPAPLQQQPQNGSSKSLAIFGGFSVTNEIAKATPDPLRGSIFQLPKPQPAQQAQQKSLFGQGEEPSNNGFPAKGFGASKSLFKMPAVTPAAPTPPSSGGFFSRVVETSDGEMPVKGGFASQTPSNSIFKIPASSSTNGGSLFQQPTKSSSIFGGFSTESEKQSLRQAASASTSIFGQAAKETANIFQQQNGNAFASTQKVDPRKPDFTFAVDSPKQPAPPIDRASEELRRMRELEEQQAQKLKEIEAELAEQKKRAAQLERQKKVEKLQQRSSEEGERLLREVLATEVALIAEQQLMQHEELEQRSDEVLAELLDDVVHSKVLESAHEEYAVMCHDQLLLNRYFERWVAYARKRKAQKQMMEASPIWVTTDTRREQIARILHPSQQENLQLIKRYRHGEPCNFQLLLWENPDCQPHTEKIDPFALLQKYTAQRVSLAGGGTGLVGSCRFFKFVFSLPADFDELPGFEGLCNRWLSKYVATPNTSKSYQQAFVCAAQRNIGLCVRKLSGIVPTDESGEVASNRESDNADGIVFFMAGGNLQASRKRLHHLLKMSSIGKSVPIAFVAYDCQWDERQLLDMLEIDLLVEDERVSAYRFYGLGETKSSFNFPAEVRRSLCFVAKRSAEDDARGDTCLEMQSLNEWLTWSLGDEMWQRWEESSLRNPAFSKICSYPQHIVEVYHEALQRLKDLVDDDYSESPEFPEELREFVPPAKPNIPLGLEFFPVDWKSSERSEKLAAFLDSLELPGMGPASALPTNLEDYEIWLLNYGGLIIPEDDARATEASYHAIRALIQQLNRVDLQDLPVEQRFKLVNFLPVVKYFVFAHVNRVLAEFSPNLPREVIYRRHNLSAYQNEPWWLNFNTIQAVTVDYSARVEEPPEDPFKEASFSYDEMSEIIRRAEEVSRKADESLNAPPEPKKVKTSPTCDKYTRLLDKTLQEFAEDKENGKYDYSFVDQPSDDIEEAWSADHSMFQGDSVTRNEIAALERKRKHGGAFTEVDAIMERALKVVDQMDTCEDLVFRQKLKMANLDKLLQ